MRELRHQQSPVMRPSVRRQRLKPSVLVAIGLGGALGAGARYGLVDAFPARAGGVPWTTLAINLSGSFALGALLTVLLERWPPTRFVRPFVAIGFLGAFTTFSTVAVESDLLVKDSHVATALVYDVLSLAGGLVAAFVGIIAGRARRPVGRRMR